MPSDSVAAKKDLTGEPISKPDIVDLMSKIRARVRAQVEKDTETKIPFKNYVANSDNQASRAAGELMRSEDLRFLNQHHAYATALRIDSIKTHRHGIFGKLIVRIKQKFLRMLRYSIFADYFTSEAEFHVNLVHFLNDMSKYVDARDGSIFWELIRKVDHDVTDCLERIERIRDDQMASLRTSEKRLNENIYTELRTLSERLGKLEAHQTITTSQLATLDSVARGLEGIVSKLGHAISVPTTSTPERVSEDYSYLLLENRYRGSETEIRDRISIYPPYFTNATKPVLEVGPGRGELLMLFREFGTTAYGVDIDMAMVQTCKKKGLDCILGSPFTHLQNQEDRSIGGLIAIQVVEHLSFAQIRMLLDLCSRKIQKGGRIVFETVNPCSLTALSSNYFRDPTHVAPLHPDTFSYAMTLAGIKLVEVKHLSPVPVEAQLRKIPTQDYMPPRWSETVELFNVNLERLNSLIYGFQDYCVVGEA